MNTQQLFESLNTRSLRVKLRSDRQLEVVGDLSRLTDDMKTALRENRQLFLNLLDQEAIEDFSQQSVRLGSEDLTSRSGSRERSFALQLRSIPKRN